jgi:Beta-lactamase superfamily domain
MLLTRLNADSSWLIQYEGLNGLIDPWLIGAQTDGASWFSKQEHIEECMPVENLPKIDFILISHQFTDHCHRETLMKFDVQTPVFAVKSAAELMRKWNHFDKIINLNDGAKVQFGKLAFTMLSSTKFLDLVHDALIVETHEGNIFYAPHGFRFSEQQKKIVSTITFNLLIATDLTYHLPFFLGGTVNLGKSNVAYLDKILNPNAILFTHHESKKASGLVSKLAKIVLDDVALPKDKICILKTMESISS